MTESRDRSDPSPVPGRSKFAQRGQSHEERMPEDDSAQRFQEGASPGPDAEAAQVEGPPGAREQAEEAASEQAADPGEGHYGSGGSYGYGGGFEHEGEPGYQAPEQGNAGQQGGEEFYESTGSFGHERTYEREAGVRGAGKPTPLQVDKDRPRRG